MVQLWITWIGWTKDWIRRDAALQLIQPWTPNPNLRVRQGYLRLKADWVTLRARPLVRGPATIRHWNWSWEVCHRFISILATSLLIVYPRSAHITLPSTYPSVYPTVHPSTLPLRNPHNFMCAIYISWWRHQMETFSALLALCAGNSPVPVNSPHRGQWRGALMFSLICAWINDWVNNREAGDLRRHRCHHDVSVMLIFPL